VLTPTLWRRFIRSDDRIPQILDLRITWWYSFRLPEKKGQFPTGCRLGGQTAAVYVVLKRIEPSSFTLYTFNCYRNSRACSGLHVSCAQEVKTISGPKKRRQKQAARNWMLRSFIILFLGERPPGAWSTHGRDENSIRLRGEPARQLPWVPTYNRR
jgi:hypothetical protein